MSKADDVSTLFRRFGGDASTYQEVQAEQQVELAVTRWPMLDQISPQLRPMAPAGTPELQVSGVRTHHVVSDALSSGASVADRLLLSAQAPVVLPQVLIAPTVPTAEASVEAPVTSGQPASSVVEVAPQASALVQPLKNTDLESMFQRMLPKKQAPVKVATESGLKRLAKW